MVHLVKAMVFPVVMYGCESWSTKKAECRRTDAFELWCWRRLLRVPWTARKSNKSIPKETSPDIHWKDRCWSWNSNTLATWCEELTHWKRPRCWERLKMGGEEDDRGWDGWMALPTQWTWVWVSSRIWWWTGRPGVLQSMGSQRVRYDWTTEPNWTTVHACAINPSRTRHSLLTVGPRVLHFYRYGLSINIVAKIFSNWGLWIFTRLSPFLTQFQGVSLLLGKA